MIFETALLALGSNLPSAEGAPVDVLDRALSEVGRGLGDVVACSRYFVTKAVPAGSGPDFVNACARVSLSENRSPGEILTELHAIEARHGRTRRARWAPRVLDLDLLALGERIVPDRATLERWMAFAPEAAGQVVPPGPILPHPRLHERAFVLVPLAEIAPDWVHPVTGRDVRAMLAALAPAERADVVPIGPDRARRAPRA